jgi:hypothetical protein
MLETIVSWGFSLNVPASSGAAVCVEADGVCPPRKQKCLIGLPSGAAAHAPRCNKDQNCFDKVVLTRLENPSAAQCTPAQERPCEPELL